MTGWQYLLLVNIYLLLFYGFYVLLLRKETFFQLNRLYLVSAALLSFFIPMIQSDWVQHLFITQQVQHTIYSSPLVVYQFKPVIAHTQITIGQIVMIIYLVGIGALVARFIWQMVVLNKIINRPDSELAYSFFKKIRLAPHQQDNKVIAAHEHVHAKQWHSADVLLIEAVMIINWFNPIVYLYRYAIKHIHEFIADRQAVKHGTSKSDYALLLLSQTFNAPAHQLVNPFYNHSLLKQRIMMLQKNKSNRIALIKYGLSAPLFILMLILSSATISDSKTVSMVNKKAEQVFSRPANIIAPSDVVLSSSSIATNKPAETIKSVSVTEGPTIPTTLVGDTVPTKQKPVYTSVQRVPQFPGGLNAFYQFLAKNTHYPADAVKKGIQGKVIVSYVVEADGSLSDVRVARGVAPDIDAEALRVMKLSPNWEPGTQDGKAVRVAYSVPINFALADGGSTSKPVTGSSQNPQKDQKVTVGTISQIALKSDTSKRVSGIVISDSSNPPLYMLDGKPVTDLATVNPEDIESITVLKDGSAKALYGEKGAKNGVILIATKNGQKGSKQPPAKPSGTKQ